MKKSALILAIILLGIITSSCTKQSLDDQNVIENAIDGKDEKVKETVS